MGPRERETSQLPDGTSSAASATKLRDLHSFLSPFFSSKKENLPCLYVYVTFLVGCTLGVNLEAQGALFRPPSTCEPPTATAVAGGSMTRGEAR